VTNQWGGLDADFCPHAFKTTPLEFYVWVCPACGFAGRKKDFEAKLPAEEKAALAAGLKPCEPIRKGARQAEIPGHVKYDLLAQAARIRGAPPEEAGRACLHASWSCRQQGAVDLDDFEEWEALRANYGLQQTPMQLGTDRDKKPRNRTEFELAAAARIEKDVEAKRYERGVQRLLSRYLLAHLYRKHGENADAERWLKDVAALKGENSVVDAAAARMRASIDREREYQRKAAEAYSEAARKAPPGARSGAEFAYILGEIHRRLGDPQAASEWFQKAIDGSASEALKELARRQKAIVGK